MRLPSTATAHTEPGMVCGLLPPRLACMIVPVPWSAQCRWLLATAIPAGWLVGWRLAGDDSLRVAAV